MAIRVHVPLFDANITEGVLRNWRHPAGSRVDRGQPLVDFITDKANFEIESPADGVLLSVVAGDGSAVPAGYCIAVIGDPGESPPDVADENRRVMEEHLRRVVSGLAGPAVPVVETEGKEPAPRRVNATPRARKLAGELGVDLEAVRTTTGVERVTEKDVRSFVERTKEAGAMGEAKVAIVTGGARGIGKAIVEALSHAGFTVGVNYAHSEDAAQKLVREITSGGGKAFAVKTDVRDSEQVKAMFQEAAKHGNLTVLVNNAGLAADNFTPFMQDREWDQVLEVNLKGAFLCTREAAKVMMRRRSGRIVNVSSVAGLSGDIKRANYASAKAGLIGLTKAVARDLAGFGVTVNAVAPGYIDTEFLAGIEETQRRKMTERIPLRRFGTPQEVAGLVTYLCGESAGYVTGAVFVIDGGLSM